MNDVTKGRTGKYWEKQTVNQFIRFSIPGMPRNGKEKRDERNEKC